ncbi:MAG: flagellar assembly protein T N-terminal domain-containing protein [Oceanospirillaceae bacterium]|nr:flagellar assembly protein T N-terminal domain-containing protein [Oceanospirillaceae bacterium]
MFSHLIRALGLFLLLQAQVAGAHSIEAEGRAAIVGNDLASARRHAILDATEQASLQAAAYISVTQQVNNGVLEVDNLHMGALGTVSNVQVISEERQGHWLLVRIRADIETEQGCSNGSGHAYRNHVAVTAFPLLHPLQANLGRLDGIESALPALLAQALDHNPNLQSHDASHYSLMQNPATAPTRQLSDASLSNLAPDAGQLGVQYLVSGVIRDLSMASPAIHGEQNQLKHWYNRLRTQDARYLRTLELELYVHDALTGALLLRRPYRTEELWNLPQHEATGFDTAAFWEQDFGRATRQLVNRISSDIGEHLACQPFRAEILRVENDRVWFRAGRSDGIARGDRLSLYRLEHSFGTTLANTRQTLIVDDVQGTTASGTFAVLGEQVNIQRGDMVVAH